MKLFSFLVPRSWRETVLRDLEDEARERGKGRWWMVGQLVCVGARLQPVINGDTMMSDFRYALKSLWRSKSFAVGALAVFAIGIGINIATFSVVDRILFRALPFAESHRLVQLRMCSRDTGKCGGGFPPAVIEEAGALSTIGPLAVVFAVDPFRLHGAGDDVPPLLLHYSSANLLDVLGVQPALGRNVSADEAREDKRVAMLSHETWQAKFGGAPDILTRELRTTTGTVPIIGVLPKGFVAPAHVAPAATWDGLAFYATPRPVAPIARLSPGATAVQAAAEIEALMASLGQPRVNGPRARADAPLPWIRVDPLESALFDRTADQAAVVAAAAALVLLLACANLAGLLMTRTRSRERELAVRVALGASRRRIITTTLLETGMLCVAGAITAALALTWASGIVTSVLPPLMARYALAHTDWRAVVAAVVASLVCTILAGLWPGLRAGQLRPTDALLATGGTGGQRRLTGGRAVLGLEAALGVVLVVAAAGALRSLANLIDEGVGLNPRGLYRVRLMSAPGTTAARVPPAEQLAPYRERLTQSRALSGVIGAAGADSVVGSGELAMRGFTTGHGGRGELYEVSAGYFAVLETRPVAGREFTDAEVDTRAHVAILNSAGLRQVFPGASTDQAVGRTMTLEGDVPRTVVGVVPQQRTWYGAADVAAVFVPLGTKPSSYQNWLVRLGDDSPDTAAAFRKGLAAATNRRVNLAPVSDWYAPGISEPRFRAVMFAAFALSGLAIAAGGIFAMTAFGVTLRRREMGVRMALGATPADVAQLVIREAMAPVAIGAAVGLGCALWTADRLQVLLYRADARDPGTATIVVVVMLATALVAAWIPARRASRVDPAIVLRSQ